VHATYPTHYILFDVISPSIHGEEQGTSYVNLVMDYARFLNEFYRKIRNSLNNPIPFDLKGEILYHVFS
jgi:hypothetical protein